MPDCRYGEIEQRWAAYDNWTFSLEFELPPALLRHPAVLLHFGGLDTGQLWDGNAFGHHQEQWLPLLYYPTFGS